MNTLDIINRVKLSCGYSSDAALARALNMSPQNFNSQKKTGHIKDTLILHAIERGVNIDWIKTGQGSMTIMGEGIHVTESQTPHSSTSNSHDTENSKTSDLLVKTAKILESQSIYRTALRNNIEAFHNALNSEIEIKNLKDRMGTIEDEMKELRERLKKSAAG